ncbi:hypothetical protein V8B97DRAFT_1996509 [Scleroderma yunnanense]
MGAPATKSPELLIKHADMLVERKDLESALKVMMRFEYIEDKDELKTFYTGTKLSNRLSHSTI